MDELNLAENMNPNGMEGMEDSLAMKLKRLEMEDKKKKMKNSQQFAVFNSMDKPKRKPQTQKEPQKNLLTEMFNIGQ